MQKQYENKLYSSGQHITHESTVKILIYIDPGQPIMTHSALIVRGNFI